MIERVLETKYYGKTFYVYSPHAEIYNLLVDRECLIIPENN